MDPIFLAALVAIAMLLTFILALQLLSVLRKGSDPAALSIPVQSMTQSVTALHGEVKSITERISLMEKEQTYTHQALRSIESAFTTTGAVNRGISDTTSAIRVELQSARQALAVLHAQSITRQELDVRNSDSIRRLEAVIAGTQTKGAAGENILEFVFAQLPPEWQVRNFPVGNRTVEFGLRLPNGLVLPIDSKWTATGILEEYLAATDPAQQQRLKTEIERAVLQKAREVTKYIDPERTMNFGIAAIPDAVFDLCPRAQVESMQWNVVLVSYSMFVPYLLLVFQTVLRTSRDIDLHKLAAHLENAEKTVRSLEEEIENRFSRALTMLANSRDELRSQLGRLSTDFAAIRMGTGAESALLLSHDENASTH